jgi:hypothetical protein
LIPKGSGDRIKTDRRDAARLARLYRAGELTPIRVPSPAEEAVGDQVRVRGDLMADLKRAKQRLLAMLLRHGRIWRTSKYWTAEHRRWLGQQSFEDPALQAAFGHYRVALAAREAEMAAIEAELLPWAHRDPLGETVAKLTAYRGVGELTALTLSSGQITRRGHIAKAGPQGVRTALVEAAWHYRHTPKVGVGLARRHHRPVPDRATPPEHQVPPDAGSRQGTQLVSGSDIAAVQTVENVVEHRHLTFGVLCCGETKALICRPIIRASIVSIISSSGRPVPISSAFCACRRYIRTCWRHSSMAASMN